MKPVLIHCLTAIGLALACSGCTTLRTAIRRWRPDTAAGSQQFTTAPSDAATLSAHGLVSGHGRSERIVVTVFNHGSLPVRLSYVADAYEATTMQGQTVTLAADFLTYPALVASGQPQRLMLSVPAPLRARDLTELVARIDLGRHVLRLRPVAQQAWDAALVVVGPGPLPTAQRPQPSAIAERRQASPWPPLGTIPVVVKFEQTFGSSLALQLWWDETAEVVTLHDREQQTFAVAAGVHALHVAIRVPGVTETAARVPVVAAPDALSRVTIRAHPRLSGVELQVQVAQGDRTVLDRSF